MKIISWTIEEPEYSKLLSERLLSRTVPTDRGCMEFQGCRNYKGYGLGAYKGKTEHVHRIVYRGKRGPIPKGWDICHTCDNPPCVNPLHLFAAPRVANLIDMRNKGRNRQTQKTHCPQGHSYAEHGKPHYTNPTWRSCTACAKDKSRRERADGTALARQRRYRERMRLQSGKTASLNNEGE